MLRKMLSSTFAMALVLVFCVFAMCSLVNAKENVLLKEEVNSSEKTFVRQTTKTEIDLNLVANLNFLAIGSNVSQVTFNAGYQCPPPRACYINQLKITGVGADGNTGSWTSSWVNPPVFSMSNNWWWRPDRGLRFDIRISGYSPRSCNVSMSRPWSGFPSRVYVTYAGSNTCNIR